MWNTKKSSNLGPNGRQGGYTPRNISQDTSARVRCADIFGARVGIVYRVYDRLRRGVTRVKRKSTYLATGDLAEHAPDQQKLHFIAVTLHPGKKVNKLDEIEWTTGLLRRLSDKRWRWLSKAYKSSIRLLMGPSQKRLIQRFIWTEAGVPLDLSQYLIVLCKITEYFITSQLNTLN